jgi:hypothetical protein
MRRPDNCPVAERRPGRASERRSDDRGAGRSVVTSSRWHPSGHPSTPSRSPASAPAAQRSPRSICASRPWRAGAAARRRSSTRASTAGTSRNATRDARRPPRCWNAGPCSPASTAIWHAVTARRVRSIVRGSKMRASYDHANQNPVDQSDLDGRCCPKVVCLPRLSCAVQCVRSEEQEPKRLGTCTVRCTIQAARPGDVRGPRGGGGRRRDRRQREEDGRQKVLEQMSLLDCPRHRSRGTATPFAGLLQAEAEWTLIETPRTGRRGIPAAAHGDRVSSNA